MAMVFFICWITSHFQEFQNAAIGKKIKIKIELVIVSRLMKSLFGAFVNQSLLREVIF